MRTDFTKIFFISCLLAMSGALWADDFAWTGLGGDDLWTNPGNWNNLGTGPGTVPGAGDRALINPTGTVNIVVDTLVEVQEFDMFSAPPADVTLTIANGGTLRFNDDSRVGIVSRLRLETGGTFEGNGSSVLFILDGELEFAGGLMTGGITFDQNPTGRLHFLGPDLKRFDGFVNMNLQGVVDWTEGDIQCDDTLAMNVLGTFNANAANVMSQTSLNSFILVGGMLNGGSAGIAQIELPVTMAQFPSTPSIDVTSGAILLNADAFLRGDVDLDSGTGLELGNGNHTIVDMTLTGEGTFKVLAGTVTLNQPLTIPDDATLLQRGGQITGTPGMNINGDFDWEAGTLAGPATVNIGPNGTMNLRTLSPKILNNYDLINQGTIDWEDGELQMNNGSQLQNDNDMFVKGSGPLVEAPGPGAVFTNNGTLEFDAPGIVPINVPFVQDGDVILSGGTAQFANEIISNGNVLLDGGNLDATNGLTMNAGTLSGSGNIGGNVVNNSAVAPGDGDIGVLNIFGDYSQSPVATLEIEAEGTTPGTDYDQLVINGLADLEGTLDFLFINGFVPTTANAFDILTYTNINMDFVTKNLPPLPVGLSFVEDIQTTRYRLVVTGTALGPPELTLEQARYSVSEGIGNLRVIVLRNGSPLGRVEGRVYTMDGTAIAEEDYQAVDQNVVFEDLGDRCAAVNIPIIDDRIQERPKQFTVHLESLSAGINAVAPTQATVQIGDNDDAFVSWQIGEQRVIEGTGRSKRMTVSVTAELSNTVVGGATASFQVSGSATQGEDYLLPGTLLGFPEGRRTATLLLEIIMDDIDEPEEDIVLTLQPVNVFVGDQSEHRIVIIDDDEAPNRPPDTTIVLPQPRTTVLVGEPVGFRASGSDEGDGQLRFNWEFCSVSGGCFTREGQVLNGVIFPRPGLYRVTCAAQDDQGAVDPTPAEILLRAVEGNQNPTVTIVSPEEADLVLVAGESVAFQAEASDPDGDPVSLAWSVNSQDEILGQGERFTFSFDDIGRYVVLVRGNDGQGGRAGDFVTVTVTEPGERPVRLQIDEPANRTVVRVGEPVDFRGRVIDVDGRSKKLNLAWDPGDGRSLSGSGPSNVTYQRPGRYRIRFIGVQDGRRLFDSVTLFVIDDNAQPLVDINIPTDFRVEPDVGGRGEVFLRAVVRQGVGHQRLSYRWDFGDGRGSDQPTPGLISFGPGEHTIRLQAITPNGIESEVASRRLIVQATEDAQFEPNESFEQAQTLTPGRYANLALNDQSNIDFFRLTIPRNNQRFVFRFDTTQAFKAEVFDRNRNPVAFVDVSREGTLQLQDLPAGTYFLCLSAEDDANKRLDLTYGMTIAVLNPGLYMTDIQEDSFFTTELGVVNITNGDSEVELLGFNAAGDIVDQVSLTLPPMGRINRPVSELFGEQAGIIAWVQVDATTDLEGYVRVLSRDGRESVAMSAATKLSSELFVPHIAAQTEQWYTRASVINGSNDRAVGEIVTPTQVDPLELNQGFSRDAFEFVDRLAGGLPDQAWAVMRENQGEPLLAGSEIFGTLDGSRLARRLATGG